ncbi:MAG: M23 family metallopeptidase [Candidatus Competibacteraceae bacterium]|nr:M23 family metallopeptidase [Candidatus Competibacteraceae bacterium]MCP5125935.1 M23 family metallopeptidase [Gammaproteobacteria bacterium]HRX69840.1 M23 family metallopeptidase [Candidatus Competibacteraceae bacterium]
MQTSDKNLLTLALCLLLGWGLIGGVASGTEIAARTPPVEPVFTPILTRVLAEPQAVLGSDRRWHLVYELELRNTTAGPAVLEQVEVRDAERLVVLEAFSGERLTEQFQIAGQRVTTALLEAAQFGILYLHLSFPDRESVPGALEHWVTAQLTAVPPGQERSLSRGEPSEVGSSPTVVLGPPLQGAGYIAADGCCASTRHLRALLPLNGEYRLSQRFAIDWEKLDRLNRIYEGPRDDPHSYFIYGQPVLAVAPARVAVAVDGLLEATPGAFPENLPLAEADGNHIILDLGRGAYVLYAHLQPGSVQVRAGDRVQRGQVLGRVGNSGNSIAPHLHLQVMDAPSGLVANGLPYVFSRFRITGVDEAGTADFDHAEETGQPAMIVPVQPPSRHIRELPLDLTVIDWLNL